MVEYKINDKLKICVCSREVIQAIDFKNNKNIILTSIYSSGGNAPKIKNLNRENICYLQFDDIDLIHYPHLPNELDKKRAYEYQLFNIAMSHCILDFVFDQHRFDTNNEKVLFAHCDAGVSRSAAVGAAIAKITFDDDMLFFKRLTPNQFVYKTLLEQWFGKIIDDSEVIKKRYLEEDNGISN